MRRKAVFTAVLVAALSAFASGAATQQDEHHSQGQANQGQSTPGMSGPMTGQGMMSQGGMGGMMGMMSQMKAHHQQMTERMNKLMKSMEAIENEKDPAALKSKLAEHSALMKEMHEQMMRQGNMMRDMSGMMMKSCPSKGGESDKDPSTK